MKGVCAGLTRLVAVAIALSLGVTCAMGIPAGSFGAAAQDGGATASLSGVEITWDEPWIVGGESASSSSLQLEHEASVVYIARGAMPAPGVAISDALTGLGAIADTRHTVDSAEGEDISFSLDLVAISGQVAGSFALVRSGADGDETMSLFLAPVAGFAEGFNSAQSSISIDGTPLFDGVDGGGLQAALATELPAFEESVQPESEVATPEADAPVTSPTAEPTASPTQEPGEDSEGSVTPEPTEVPTEEPTPEPTVQPTVEPTEEPEREPSDDIKDILEGEDEDIPYSDAGMIGPRSYESPQYGVEIEWSRDWELDEDFGEAVISNPKTEVDVVHLLWTDEGAAWIGVYMLDSYSATVPSFVEYFSESLVESGEGEVVLADSSGGMGGIVTLVDDGGSDPVLIYHEVRYGPGRDSFVVTEMISLDPRVTDAIIRAAQDDISIDGEAALTYYSPDDVEEIHEEGETDGPVLDQEPRSITQAAAVRSRGRAGIRAPRYRDRPRMVVPARMWTPGLRV